jgi:hypothetical protein
LQFLLILQCPFLLHSNFDQILHHNHHNLARLRKFCCEFTRVHLEASICGVFLKSGFTFSTVISWYWDLNYSGFSNFKGLVYTHLSSNPYSLQHLLY